MGTQTHLRLRMQKKNMTPTLVILAVTPRERAGMMPPDLKRRPRRLLKLRRKPKKAERKKTSAPREKKEGGERRKKKTKLPGQPKKPMSAYFLWLNGEGREKIKEENPAISVTEVSKKAGEIWGSLSSDIKEKYEKKNKEAKEAYEIEYKNWLKDGGEAAIAQAQKDKKAEKSSGSPKKKPSKTKSSGVSTGGSGKGFNSKEFIGNSDSDSDAGKKSDGSDAKGLRAEILVQEVEGIRVIK